MRNNPVDQRKVVPFTGELYPIVPTQPQPQPQPSNDFAVITAYVALALIAGLCIGAILTYQRPDQSQLRNLQQQSSQLQQLKTQICNKE